MKQVTVRISEWLHGGLLAKTGEGVLRRESDGKMCCLGFMAEQCGVDPKHMHGTATPVNLPREDVAKVEAAGFNALLVRDNLTWDSEDLEPEEIEYINSGVCEMLMEQNDAAPPMQNYDETEWLLAKQESLNRIGKDAGIEFVFVP